MILNLTNFENQLASVNNIAADNRGTACKIDHYILNVVRKPNVATVEQIKNAIKSAKAGQLLFGIDLRVIWNSEGRADNWTLEACSKDRSLAVVGTKPTA